VGGDGQSSRPKRIRPAPWNPIASRDEARSYVQERLSLLLLLMFVVFCVLVGFVLAMYRFYPAARPSDATFVHRFAVAALCVMAAIWYFALRRRRPSIEALYWVDAACAVLTGLVFAIVSYYSADQQANVYSAFIWCTFMIFARALIVPSTGWRTTWVSAAAMVPLVVAAVAIAEWRGVDLPGPALIVGSVMYGAVTVTLAATGSRVIYGLRKQVSDAQQLGQYTLGERIGVGGMGEVYKAEHHMLRRPTAVKLLPPDRFGEESVKRFEREVQHTSQLTHPNTVAIYDYGRSPDGVFYYAMEYLDGIDLDTLVREYGPQPAGRVIHVLTQVCGALDEAHHRGLVHRDVTPSNIILCERGRVPDFAKVLDFGLVKDIKADPGLSAAKIVAGTPAYISPEGVTDPLHLGPPADIYSLGAVAYTLLTGRLVFDAATEVEMCLHHARSQPVPPSQRTENPISEELESVVMLCLEKGPSRRPASAAELRHMLARLPEANEWSEAVAHEWWRTYREGDSRPGPAGNPDPTLLSPLVITVDIRGREQLDESS